MGNQLKRDLKETTIYLQRLKETKHQQPSKNKPQLIVGIHNKLMRFQKKMSFRNNSFTAHYKVCLCVLQTFCWLTPSHRWQPSFLLLYHRALYSADNYPFLSDTYLCKFKDIFANLNLALKSAACTSWLKTSFATQIVYLLRLHNN